jgi:hypothetical protein
MDAPTVVRPDLAAMAEAEMMAAAASPPAPAPDASATDSPFPSTWDDDPHGEATVALQAPNGVTDPAAIADEETVASSPSPVQSLPGSASYSPPPSAPEPPVPPPAPPEEPREQSRSSRGVAPPPRSGDRQKKRKLPKNAQVSRAGENDRDGIQPLHLLYGAVGVAGVLLVCAAFVAGILILLAMD